MIDDGRCMVCGIKMKNKLNDVIDAKHLPYFYLASHDILCLYTHNDIIFMRWGSQIRVICSHFMVAGYLFVTVILLASELGGGKRLPRLKHVIIQK